MPMQYLIRGTSCREESTPATLASTSSRYAQHEGPSTSSRYAQHEGPLIGRRTTPASERAPCMDLVAPPGQWRI